MKLNLSGLLLPALLLAGSSLQAGLVTQSITLQTGIYTTTPTPLGTGADYVNAFNALPNLSAIASLPIYDNVTNNGTIGTGTNNIGEHFQVSFTLDPADAGIYLFRFGVDFGLGGALFIDNNLVALNPADMWWHGSYSDPAQFMSAGAALIGGTHTIDLYGFEGCCDGPQQGQWSGPSANLSLPYQTFESSAVPEPATFGLVGLAAAGLIALKRRG